MYTSEAILESNGRIQRVHIFHNGIRLQYGEVLKLWQADNTFRAFFLSILSDVPYASYRWETVPVTKTTLGRLFDFVLLDSPSLRPSANPAAFAEFLGNSSEDVVAFRNLGKDAILIAPTLKERQDTYAHLASFTRQAAEHQKHAFWRKVGEIVEQNVSEKPIWLNTAGAGVAWLHVRLDSSPKYYGYSLFLNFP
jgi:hypothetical protein